MSEATTLERPAETAQTQAELPDETQATPVEGGGTDVQGEVQSDQTPAESEETPEQHLAKLEADRVEAERAALREEERAKLETERATNEAKQREAQRKQRAKDAFPNAKKAMDAILDSFEDPPRQEFYKALESVNLVAEELASERVGEQYHEAIATLLGQDADAFWKDAEALEEEDGSIPVAALLEALVERQAVKSKFLKGMSLEDAKKASPALARDLAIQLKKEFERGQQNPLPPGEPGSDGVSVSRGVLTADEATNLPIEQLIARRNGR